MYYDSATGMEPRRSKRRDTHIYGREKVTAPGCTVEIVTLAVPSFSPERTSERYDTGYREHLCQHASAIAEPARRLSTLVIPRGCQQPLCNHFCTPEAPRHTPVMIRDHELLNMVGTAHKELVTVSTSLVLGNMHMIFLVIQMDCQGGGWLLERTATPGFSVDYN